MKYVTGDFVYYKRIDSKEWHGPAKVLSQDGQQVLVKNGSNYFRVHLCRLQLIYENPEIPKTPTTEAQENDQKYYLQLPNNKQSHSIFDTSDSEDEEPRSNHNNCNVETAQPLNIEEVTPTMNQTYPEYKRPSALNDKKLKNKLAELRPKTKIKYKVNKNDNLQSAEIISRAGKSSGKN